MVDKDIFARDRRCTFDEFTLSPFSSTKLGLDKWLKYCELMILGLSIRQCAEEVGVGVKNLILYEAQNT